MILEARPDVQRLIEIGPSKVLSSMAQKTLNRKFLSQDRSRVVKRQLLSDSADAKAIYYEYEESNDTTEETSEHVSAKSANQPISQIKDDSALAKPSTLPPVQPAKEQSNAPPAASSPIAAVKSIDDVPLSAADVVSALVAQKFKQPQDELLVDKTIRDLSGGKHSVLGFLLHTRVLMSL